jgi:hypothetical protein
MLIVLLITCIILGFKKRVTRETVIKVCVYVSYLTIFMIAGGEADPLPVDQILKITFINGTMSFVFSCLICFLIFRKRFKVIENLHD